MNGWVKLWRKSLDSDVFADANLWRLFCWCLLRANRKPRHVSVNTGMGSTIVALEAGQFVTGRKAGGAELGWAGSTFRRRLEQLASMGVIAVKPDTHFSIVSIVNWGIYQASGRKSGQATVQASDRQQYKHRTQTRREEKEEKREPAKAGDIPGPLLELVDGWNGLGPTIVRPGNGARRDPPAKAAIKGWKKAQKQPDQRTALENIPAVLAAIRAARFCHGQGWFTLPWLFGSNRNGEFNICRLLAGAHDGANGNGQQVKTPEPITYRA